MAQALNQSDARLVISKSQHDRLWKHLFPGDGDEHGAVIAATLVLTDRGIRLLVRDVIPATDGVHYVPGEYGYRALTPQFIYKALHHCRERGLCYLAVHNHGGRDWVDFSDTDRESHRRGYPALLGISRGLPVGAMVFAKNAASGELWITADVRLPIIEMISVGQTYRRFYPSPRTAQVASSEIYDRQVRMFGDLGQEILGDSKIAILGAGGAGSIENQLAAHLGVGEIVTIDPDHLDASNRSRVVGANELDCPALQSGTPKVEIAERVARQANPLIQYAPIQDNVAYDDIAMRVRDCDFIFLAADSMQARLVFNALVHQYLIPGIQVGTKVAAAVNGDLDSAFTVVRWVTPDEGCLLCNGLIDGQQLALEAKSTSARKMQDYGTHQHNPSVITMNAVAAAHAVNDFMMAYLQLGRVDAPAAYRRFEHLHRRVFFDRPRRDTACTECGREDGSRFAMGDRVQLPTMRRRVA